VNSEDEASFGAFYAASYARVVRALIPLAGSVAEAEDLAQEAFTRGFVRWSRLQGYDQPEAWVRAVAMNLALSRLRKLRNGARALGRLRPPTTVADPSSGIQERRDLVQILERLPMRQRAALVLYYACDRSVEQISVDLRMSAGTVKSTLARGRDGVRRHLIANAASDQTGAH
jgi:RNA polymerase sigma-70 factor, ECF subfamily